MDKQLTTNCPNVFLSYSYDGDDHKHWVRRLAENLELGGVHVVLDQWDLLLGMDLAEFMEKNVDEADFILVICTPEYAKRANSRDRGVGYESTVVTADVLSGRKKDSIIPVLRCGTGETALPRYLRTKLFVDMRNEDSHTRGTADLLGRFHHRPRYTRPPTPNEQQQPTSSLDELIKLAEAKRDWSEKRRLYREALQIQETPEIHRKAAWCSLHLNEFESARDHDLRAVAINPDYVHGWVGLTVAGSYLGDRAMVENSFAEVQKRADHNDVLYAEAAFYYGQQLFRIGKRTEARAFLTSLLDSQVDNKYFQNLRRQAKAYIGE